MQIVKFSFVGVLMDKLLQNKIFSFVFSLAFLLLKISDED